MSFNLNVVHIGKCGGGSVKHAISQSSILSEKFKNIKITHIKKAKFSSNESYLIIIRHPVERALSAFNWRYHLVVQTEQQKSRFRGEWLILKKYATLNSMAEKLYCPNTSSLNKTVSREFRSIHHLREDICFYLADVLKHVNPKQIYGVVKQHSLAFDCQLLLGPCGDIKHDKKHGDSIDPSRKNLSVQAKRNLRRFLHEDFACILKLYNIGAIDWDDYEILTR